MSCRQGPSERHSRPRLCERKGPAAVAVGRIAPTGRTAPKAPAGQSCWDDDISVTGHACMALTKTNSAE